MDWSWRGWGRAAGRKALAGLTAIILPLGASVANAEPAIWKITDEDSTLWLFGSVHSLPEETPWRTPALEEALATVETVYFEAPMDLFAQAKLQSYILSVGLNPPGQTLSSQLPPDVSAELYRVSGELGVNPMELEAVRPWLAVMILSAKLAEAGGADPAHGVDPILSLDAMRAQKEIRTFETLEQQAGFFANLTHEQQVDVLRLTLEEASLAEQTMAELVTAWASGDLDTLERLIFDGMEGAPEVFSNALFRDRNAAWAEELDQYLDGAGTALVVVGAGHLVGDESVLEFLSERGWTIERIHAGE